MGYMPKMPGETVKSVKIPALNGGINLRDSVSAVGDNQLTDSLNMWFNNGMLTTRPGFIFRPDGTTYLSSSNDEQEEYNVKSIPNEVKIIQNSIEYFLNAYAMVYKEKDLTRICFQFVSFEGNAFSANQLEIEDKTVTAFVIQYKTDIYCFVSGDNTAPIIYKLSEDKSEWNAIEEEDYYIPIVATGCKTNNEILMTNDEILSNGGVMFEGYNTLCGYYRMVYSTVNVKLLEDENSVHYMTYFLLNNTKKFPGKKVTAVITKPDGTKYKHSVTITDTQNWDIEQVSPGDGIYMQVFNRLLYFRTSNTTSSGSIANVRLSDFLEDNMEITAPCDVDIEKKKKVFNMTANTWFGGSSGGIFKGTRLFLGGNKTESEKNLVVWSDLEKPLYFPENNYAYIGNATSAVTAFGKQADLLVIFKENEIYTTKYALGSDYDAEDLINRKVVDVTSLDATFPITQLHGYIGCDCPKSVQLCNNRLVWATSHGKVYTLASSNQYSEKTVIEISSMIDRCLRLEARQTLKDALSCDWMGHYILFADKNIYVLDYNSSGFNMVNSYSRSDDVSRQVPWYFWRINEKIHTVISNPRDILCFALSKANVKNTFWNYAAIYRFDADKSFDENADFDFLEIIDYPKPIIGSKSNIKSVVQTKVFDLGTPFKNKKVSRVEISFGNNFGLPVKVSALNEDCDNAEEHFINLNESDKNKFSSMYLQKRNIRLLSQIVNRLGIRLECEGEMAVNAVSFNYKILGGD